jgi:serine/threonine protein phosphatase 1
LETDSGVIAARPAGRYRYTREIHYPLDVKYIFHSHAGAYATLYRSTDLIETAARRWSPMIGKLFTRRRPDEEPAQIPPGRRVYAVGDIHGRADLLRRLHRRIRQHAAAENYTSHNVVVYLGDYVDRGPDSRGVIDLLINEPLSDFEQVHLKGNHEDSLLRFLIEEWHGPQWFTYGGEATLESYDVRPARPSTDPAELKRAQAAFARKLPSQHLDFFKQLRTFYVEGDYAFVHAGIRPGIALEEQSDEDLLWIRDEFLRSNGSFGKVIVHGHSISDSPIVRHNRIGIDTGAFVTGCLTCLVLEGTGRRFLQT